MEILGLESPWLGTDITYALSSCVARFNKLEDSSKGEDIDFVGVIHTHNNVSGTMHMRNCWVDGSQSARCMDTHQLKLN